MQDYHKLIGWQKAHAVAISVQRLTQDWSRRENSGLIGQVRRAALSIPSNIAEGCGRSTDKDFAKFLQQAVASTVELQYQMEFAHDSGIIDADVFRVQRESITEVRRILVGLIKHLRK